jgi:hypothetical protein
MLTGAYHHSTPLACIVPVGIKVISAVDIVAHLRMFWVGPTPQVPIEVKVGQLKTVVWADAGIRNPNAISARNKYLFIRMSIQIDLESNRTASRTKQRIDISAGDCTPFGHSSLISKTLLQGSHI